MKKFCVTGLAALVVLGGLSVSSAQAASGRLLKSNETRIAAADRSDGRFDSLIASYATANNVPLSLAHAVITVESNYQPNMRGSAGEIGLMQVKLQTARGMGYTGTAKGLYEPATNIRYGMLYLGQARKLAGGDLCGTILKYNGGHGATRMSKGPLRYCGKVQQLIASN
ncbi:soluble lytic murein transglycosylase-like protein [Kaistia dalseonensis]|uniref:Soluble lytic murein transglycosylase-like protein n=1 Tax=Kaistia dalseonensis TaxID=410840 RepID=A0ABU0HD65_9HYPH|nr:transglycosylase SLT domain-containing protein [Kaistia dalseonensis]MDQ0439783.1 soluble lytic murein transglycosylase-like protein [Kaistia dalseonensis]